ENVKEKRKEILTNRSEAGHENDKGIWHIGGELRSGQTIFSALASGGVPAEAAEKVVKALSGIFSFRRARPGDRYKIVIDEDGKVKRFDYRTIGFEHFVVEAKDGKLAGRKEELPRTKRVFGIGGRIHSSLYEALREQGQDPSLAYLLVDAFAWDIDFYCDPRSGDVFKMVVEEVLVDGRPIGLFELLAAEYKGAVVSVKGFRHKNVSGGYGYYTEDGRNLQKTFLKSPLKYARITSKFGWRVHPILGFSRKHNGVDFGAPRGTPIWAAADGTVERAGWLGHCGRGVILRHPTGHETIYCHMSKLGRGIRPGVRVEQKQIIGLVGATGRATGPHLHYGMKFRGRFINPLKQHFPRGKPLSKDEMDSFGREVRELNAILNDIQIPGESLVRGGG
ncbi:MAG: M23 family metallopeptidase, partial [Deltaproteobacteria bacterium]|nr:M23 family metallopeptidase [Deltaproteobacteria bacterium]